MPAPTSIQSLFLAISKFWIPNERLQRRPLSLAPESLEPRMMLSSVQILAAGTTGQEQIEFQVEGQTVQTFSGLGSGAYSGNYVTLSLNTAGTIAADDVRIQFINDVYDPANNIDRSSWILAQY